MEYLALYSNLKLNDFCHRIKSILSLAEFEFDYENETEWGESQNGVLIISVSRPFQKGTLQEWDDTVPIGCNFGVFITKKGIELDEIEETGKLIANEFKSSVFYHRTWLGPGENIKREIEIKPGFKNT